MGPTKQISNQLEGCAYVAPAQFTKTVAASGTPEALSSTALFFRHATILGRKAARTANTGNVWVGATSTNDAQPFLIPSDGEIVIEAPTGAKFNFQDWYLDVATNADGVVVIYY